LTHGQRRPLGRRQLANQSAPEPTRIEIKLIKKERIRVDNPDVVRLDRCGGEILHVERHHHLGSAGDRRCQNVAIFRITRHGLDQRVVVHNLRRRERPLQLPDQSRRLHRVNVRVGAAGVRLARKRVGSAALVKNL
jgi:hypothetical protein